MKRRLFTPVLLAITTLLFSANMSAQKINDKISAIPYPLEILNTPVKYSVNDSGISITAAGKTNMFNNPDEKSNVRNAPMILFEPKENFTISAKVSGELKAVYDVAALIIYSDSNTWAKFCYENSVEKEPIIVSMVTRTFSDDCNSLNTGSFAYLSIVKKGNEYSFYYSVDKVNWMMIRHFNLKTENKVKIGFAAHGSRGDGFTALFSDIKYQDRALGNLSELY